MRPDKPTLPAPDPGSGPATPVMLQLKPIHVIRDGPACEIVDRPRGDTQGNAIRLVP